MKNYAVIGASTGIGKSVKEKLLSEGHQVYATHLNNEIPIETNLTVEQFDVRSDDQMNIPFDKLDGVVYCPGAIDLKPFARIKPEKFLRDYELQVLGAIKSIQAVLTHLKKADNPSIVLFSTVAVQTGFNFHSLVASSKGAIEGLTRSLAAEFAPKIRVNAIAPSLTDTPLAERMLNSDAKKEANDQRHPLKRIGRAEDISHAVMYLLSEKSSWVSGQIFHIDGGMSSIKS